MWNYKKTYLHKQWIQVGRALVWSLCLLFVACQTTDDEPAENGIKEQTQIAFSLVIPSPKAVSRGTETWNPLSYNPQSVEEAYDNFVDLSTVQVLLFDTTTHDLVGKVGDLLWQRNSADIYTFKGSINRAANNLQKQTNYKIMVFANCPTISPETNLDDLRFLMYDGYNPQTTPYIPFWGSTTKNLTLEAGEYQHVGDIYLLRSLAKVNVQLSDEVQQKGYTLKGVSINRYNAAGYCLPTGWRDAAETTQLNIDAGLRPMSSSLQESAKAFTTNNQESVFYLCEFRNTGTGTTPASLTVIIEKDGIYYEFPDAIEFREYAEGIAQSARYDILRNHLYKFTIQGVYGTTLNLTTTVQEWEMQEETIDFTDVLSINNHIEWVPNSIQNIDNQSLEVRIKPENTPMQCHFSLATPQGATWYAELITIESSPDNTSPFGFVDGSGNFLTDTNGYPLTTVSGGFGVISTLRIKATKPQTGVVNKVRLHFIIRTGGRTSIISNLVDGQPLYKEYVLVQEVNN